MGLYAQISRMRVLSSTSAVECADQMVEKIIATYLEPNKTFPELDGQRAHPLRAVDENSFNVRRGRWARVEGGVMTVVELGPAIGVMEVNDDVGRVEQHD